MIYVYDTSKEFPASVDLSGMCKGMTSTGLTIGSMPYTANTANLSEMFMNCSNLESLDISELTTNRYTVMTDMFAGCTSLTQVVLGGNLHG